MPTHGSECKVDPRPEHNYSFWDQMWENSSMASVKILKNTGSFLHERKTNEVILIVSKVSSAQQETVYFHFRSGWRLRIHALDPSYPCTVIPGAQDSPGTKAWLWSGLSREQHLGPETLIQTLKPGSKLYLRDIHLVVKS
jgi:hypothetical protein